MMVSREKERSMTGREQYVYYDNRYGVQPMHVGYGQPAMLGGAQPPGYYPQPRPPAQWPKTHAVVKQPRVTRVETFQDSPVHTRCPSCQANVVTRTYHEVGTFAWLVCILLCCVGCNLGCCLIPFFLDACRDVVHFCPNCRQQVARWSRM